jgi:hypothetical protein
MSGRADIRAAWQACGDLRNADLAWFRSQGVSAFALAGYRQSPTDAAVRIVHGLEPACMIDLLFHVTRDRVRFLRSSRFVFERDCRGEPNDAVSAYVLPELDVDGELVDLVAWHPRTSRLASWQGATGLLGAAALDTLAPGEPATVRRSPIEWLAAWRTGVVVVHDRAARPALLAVGCVQAADLEHGIALERMLREVALPRIVVPAFPDEEAA